MMTSVREMPVSQSRYAFLILTLQLTLQERYDCFHATDEGTEALREKETCPGSLTNKKQN